MQKRVIGIDVAKDSLSICIDRDTDTLEEFDLPNTAAGHCRLLEVGEMLAEEGEVVYVLEATGVYHELLVFTLLGSGHRVGVLNPLVMRRFSQMKCLQNKTDRSDAVLIARFGQEQSIRQHVPYSMVKRQLQSLETALELLIKSRTAAINQRHSFTVRVGVDPFALAMIHANIEFLDRCIKNTIHRQEKLVKTYLSEEIALLRSIPGIGPRVSRSLVMRLGDGASFASAKQLIAYIGTNPTNKQSGVSLARSGPISKHGSGRLRALLFMAALTAVKHNAGCRLFYERLVERGKPKKVALIAVVNKLLRQILAVLHKREAYIDGFGVQIT